MNDLSPITLGGASYTPAILGELASNSKLSKTLSTDKESILIVYDEAGSILLNLEGPK